MGRQPMQRAGDGRDRYIDAIRAIAISEVLANHAFVIAGVAVPFQLIGRAPIGVQAFFVLSGWLLGGQLIRSLRRDGTINLPRFWARRWIRTVPVYYAVLALRVVALGLVGFQGHAIFTPGLLVFAQNYTAKDAWGITWSLCVQEHFYLALPLVLLLVARLPRLAVMGTAVFFLAMSPVLRWFQFGPAESFRDYFVTHLRLDALVLGVALAALKERGGWPWSWCVRHGTALAATGVAVILVLASTPLCFEQEGAHTSALGAAFGELGLGLGATLLIPASVAAARSVGRPWWSLPARWLADHAYVLYLVHSMVFVGVEQFWRRSGLPYAAMWIAMFAATLALAAVFRAVVEKPTLSLRDAISARLGPGRTALPVVLVEPAVAREREESVPR